MRKEKENEEGVEMGEEYGNEAGKKQEGKARTEK